MDILAPGPHPDEPPGGGGGGNNGNQITKKKKKKRWHVAYTVMPGGCFSGPLGELHVGCPTDHKVVCAAPHTTLLVSFLRDRWGGLDW